MKVLLIGAGGQLGGDIVRNNRLHEIVAPDRTALDLTRSGQMGDYMRALRPDVVINCAAFHNVPLCEEQPELAFRVNCAAVRDLAALCEQAGCWLVTFSSDYVFGGDKGSPYFEDDRAAPLQIYGITRLAGEHAALAAAPQRAIVIRTCGLYGRSGAKSKRGNFVDQRIEEARRSASIEIGSDQTVSPTSTHDLSNAVMALIAHSELKSGIYHLVNEGACTWYELARAAVELLGLAATVVPVDRGGRTGAMRRPLYSALANARARALGIVLPPWREALANHLRTRYEEERTGRRAPERS